MDEPFGALDLQTRFLMQGFLAEIWRDFKKTVAFVTHQVDEAVLLSDRVLVMSANRGQIGAEFKITLSHPRDSGSAEFNMYRAEISGQLRREVNLFSRCRLRNGERYAKPIF